MLYNHDFTGRLNALRGSDGTRLGVEYDDNNHPNRLTFKQNNATIYDASYTSDAQGKVTGTTLHSLGNTALNYTYDGLNRATQRDLVLDLLCFYKSLACFFHHQLIYHIRAFLSAGLRKGSIMQLLELLFMRPE